MSKIDSSRLAKASVQNDMLDSILLSYQLNWVRDTSKVKFYEKSRRIGITWAEALDNVLLAASSKGMDIWYIGYNKDMAKEYIDTCAEWAKKLNQAVSKIYDSEIIDEDKKILSYSITFHSGHKITALSGRPSNLRGKQGKAVIDEAAFHDDLKETMKAALAFLIWGGSVAVISTHFGEDNIFNEYIKDIRAGRLNYSLHRTTFDDAIADGLYERVMAVTGRGERFLRGLPNSRLNREETEFAQAGDDTVGAGRPVACVSEGSIHYDQACIKNFKDEIFNEKVKWIQSIYADYGDSADEELRCIPSRQGGAYFSTALIENCMADIPVIRIDAPDNIVDLSEHIRKSYTNDIIMDKIIPLLDNLDKSLNYYVGVDFARLVDLSVFWTLQENKNLIMQTPFIVELRNTPFEMQKDILHFILKHIPKFSGIALDARGNGAYLAETTRQVFGAGRTLEVQASEKFYLNSFPKLKARFEDKTIIIPKDADILQDFRAVKVIKGVPKISDIRSSDKTGKRHGDSAAACLLANYARSELGVYETWEYVSIGNNDLYEGY